MTEGVWIALIGTLGVVLAAGIPAYFSRSSLRRIEDGVNRVDNAVNGVPPGSPPIKQHAQTAAVESTETNRRLVAFELSASTAEEHAREARRLAGLALTKVESIDAKLSRLLPDVEGE